MDHSGEKVFILSRKITSEVYKVTIIEVIICYFLIIISFDYAFKAYLLFLPVLGHFPCLLMPFPSPYF